MALWVILAIILVGLLLIFLEIFFIPGTTLFGIAGGVAVVAGVLLMYSYYGQKAGNITMIISLTAVFVSIALGFRVIQTNKLAMKGTIDSRVNDAEVSFLNVGDTGTTITELRPNGKAVFGNNKLDVYSTGDYVKRDTAIEIIKITGNKILVQPIKT
ncbi:MAG: NfeD family protein [Chitinophagales bacterium]